MASNPQQGSNFKKPNSAPNRPKPNNPGQSQPNRNKKSDETTNHGNRRPQNPHNQNKTQNFQNKNPQQKKPNDWVFLDHLRPTMPMNCGGMQPNPQMQLNTPMQLTTPMQLNTPKQPKPPKQSNNQKPGPSVSATEKVLSEVLSVLECPVCLEFIQAPIFMCEAGHNICGPCRAKLFLPICPLCKTAVTGQRNFDLEKIASKMATPCTNSSHGCKFMGSPDEAKLHFENCSFRRMFCPMGREFNMCTWNGSISELQIHFAEEHQNNTRLKPGCQVLFDNFDITKKDEDMQLIGVGKFLYLYHVKIDPSKSLALWGIQFIGPHQEAAKTKYEFNIFNNKKTKKVITYSDECQPDNLSFQDIYDSGNCVAIPLHVLKNYIHENKKFTFKFFIKPGENPKPAQNPRPTQPLAQASSQPNRLDMNEMFALSSKLDLL